MHMIKVPDLQLYDLDWANLHVGMQNGQRVQIPDQKNSIEKYYLRIILIDLFNQ